MDRQKNTGVLLGEQHPPAASQPETVKK